MVDDHTRLAELLRDTAVGMVRRDAPDLSMRQLAVLLVCQLDEPPRTVASLATMLNMSRAAIARALERLEQLDLLKRVGHRYYAREIHVESTAAGRAFMLELEATVLAAKERMKQPPPHGSGPRHGG